MKVKYDITEFNIWWAEDKQVWVGSTCTTGGKELYTDGNSPADVLEKLCGHKKHRRVDEEPGALGFSSRAGTSDGFMP